MKCVGRRDSGMVLASSEIQIKWFQSELYNCTAKIDYRQRDGKKRHSIGRVLDVEDGVDVVALTVPVGTVKPPEIQNKHSEVL